MINKDRIRFDVLTIFPKMFDSYLKEGVIMRAIKNKILNINIYDIRAFADDKRRTVDDTTYGGGPGMVIKIEPIYKALRKMRLINRYGKRTGVLKKKAKIVIVSAKGEKFTQEMAAELSKYDRLVIICGRYEGIDERVAQYLADNEISIGEYVLTGGELPALVILDAVSRLKTGVVGNCESIEEESFSKKGYIEYPHYTKPASFSPAKGIRWNVPHILLSGDHAKIKEWRKKRSKSI